MAISDGASVQIVPEGTAGAETCQITHDSSTTAKVVPASATKAIVRISDSQKIKVIPA